ncbi:MAG TPA: hypothetical protein VEW47_11310 [Candidatus Dormibacteraeota bacterium]|nr:hypothetical protein [Candidatus Dormibacteraeota bacterium]
MAEQSPGVFVLSPAYFQRLRRTILWTAGAITLGSIALANLTGRRAPNELGSKIFAWVFVIVVVGITLYLNYKKQVARWRTFRVAVSRDQVLRTQDGSDDVIAAASAITRMVRIPGRGLLIYTGHAQPAIIIPDTLEQFDACCTLIQRFGPIDVRTRSALPRWLTIPAALAFMGVYIAFERSSDLRVMSALGALIACVMVFGAWRLYGSPDVDKKAKKRFAWILLLAIVPVGMRIWSTWNAPRRIDQEIRDDRLLSLLDKARPDLHERLRDAMLAGEKNRIDAHGGAYVNPAVSVISEILPQYLPICSDESVIRYAKETVTVLERLEADPSDICDQWLRPHGVHVDLLGVLGKDGLNPLTDAMVGVMESALTAPQAAPDVMEAETLRARALENMTKEDRLGRHELRPPEAPGTDKKAWCHTVENTFRAVLDLPQTQSSLVLRYMFSQATKK